jgi:hypothetical protein
MVTGVKASRVTGMVLHVLVAGLMIFAGLGKVIGFAPAEVVKKMGDFGLGDRITLIGVGEITTALLLLAPVTSSLGVLSTSAFWGGVICITMAHGESYVLGSVMLVLTWVGAYLRDRSTLASFHRAFSKAPTHEL